MPSTSILLIEPAVVGGVFGLIGAFFGGVLGPLISFRLNDKARKMSLYTSVFPEKVKAAKQVMEAAHALFSKVHSTYPTVLPQEELDKRMAFNEQREKELLAAFSEGVESGKLWMSEHQDSMPLHTQEQTSAWEAMSPEISSLAQLGWANEWLLGIETKNGITDFITSCHSKIVPPYNSWRCELEVQAYGPGYRRLENVIRKQIHLPELEEAVKVKTKQRDPLSLPREG